MFKGKSDRPDRYTSYERPDYKRPEYKRPDYERSEYDKPEYKNPQYDKPDYKNPEYEKPQYKDPDYEKPQYKNPDYEKPEYKNSEYDKPEYKKPEYEKPQYKKAKYKRRDNLKSRSNVEYKRNADLDYDYDYYDYGNDALERNRYLEQQEYPFYSQSSYLLIKQNRYKSDYDSSRSDSYGNNKYSKSRSKSKKSSLNEPVFEDLNPKAYLNHAKDSILRSYEKKLPFDSSEEVEMESTSDQIGLIIDKLIDKKIRFPRRNFFSDSVILYVQAKKRI